jgi:hypothetical protein
VDFVEVFSALFAEILVWRAFFRHDAYAGAMLPNFADIALYEKTRNLVRKFDPGEHICVLAILSMLQIIVYRRRTWVVVEAA